MEMSSTKDVSVDVASGDGRNAADSHLPQKRQVTLKGLAHKAMIVEATVSEMSIQEKTRERMNAHNEKLLNAHHVNWREVMTKDIQIVKDFIVRHGDLQSLVFCALGVAMSVFMVLFAKVTFGTRTPEEQPDIGLLLSVDQFLGTGMYGALAVWIQHAEMKELWDPKAWLVCLPYSACYMASYFILFTGLQYISGTASIAIMQARLFVDLLVEHFFLGGHISMQRFVGCTAIFLSVVVYVLRLPSAADSPNPALGTTIFIIYNFWTALTYAYLPWMLPLAKKRGLAIPSTITAIITSFESAVICFVYSGAGSGGNYAASAARFIPLDAVFLTSLMLVDIAYFFIPLYVSPLALTMCAAVNIPILYFLEAFFFPKEFDVLSIVGVTLIVLTVASYGIAKMIEDRVAHDVAKMKKEQEKTKLVC